MAQIGAQFVNAVSGLPVGTVIYDYPSNNIPSGWIATDGQAVSRTDYAALFNVLGTNYGVGNGSTTFNLPKQAIVSDSGGRVKLPYQPRVFGTKTDYGNWLKSNPWIFNSAPVNVGSHYNTSTGLFTCPTAGEYLVQAWWLALFDNNYGYMSVNKNGTGQSPDLHFNSMGSGYSIVTGSWILACAANDTISFSTNGGTYVGCYGASHNGFSIQLIG